VGRDEWICRIPRSLLEDLAATRTLDRSTTVLLALLFKLYGENDNSGTFTPRGTASLSWLSAKTGRHIREVRHAMAVLAAAGVVDTVEAPAGREKVLALRGGPKQPRGKTPHGSETPHTSGQNAARSMSKRRRVARGETPHPINEGRNVLSGTSLQSTVDVANVDLMRSSNGHGNGQVSETIDSQRPTRVRWILTTAVAKCMLRRAARDQWLAHVKELSVELTARTDLSESTIGRRARDFFIVQSWCNRGDSEQAARLRGHMLKPVKKKAVKR
jgi:hypothetical protein